MVKREIYWKRQKDIPDRFQQTVVRLKNTLRGLKHIFKSARSNTCPALQYLFTPFSFQSSIHLHLD